MQVFHNSSEINKRIYGARMDFTVVHLVPSHHTLKNTLALCKVPIEFPQQGLVVVDTEVGRVVLWEILLNVFTMAIKNYLSLSVSTQTHALRKFLKVILYFFEVVGRYLICVVWRCPLRSCCLVLNFAEHALWHGLDAQDILLSQSPECQ